MCEGSPQWLQHPVRWLGIDKMVPLTLHGDGTPCAGVGKAWGKVADFFSWASILATAGHSELVRFLIFVVHAHLRCAKATHNTLDVVFGMMRWSLEVLMDGRWPALDWLGNPIDYSKRALGKAWPLSLSLSYESCGSSYVVSDFV